MRRVLYVDVVRAKSIIGVNKKAGNSDPYVEVALENIGGREIKNEKFFTKVITKTLAPEWNERLTFGHSYDLNSSGELPTLVVKMYHKGGMLQSDEPMGKISIPLDTIDPSGIQAAAFYPLAGDSRTKYAAGEVIDCVYFNFVVFIDLL